MRAIRYAIPFLKLYRDTDTDRDRGSVSVSGYKLYPIPTSLVVGNIPGIASGISAVPYISL